MNPTINTFAHMAAAERTRSWLTAMAARLLMSMVSLLLSLTMVGQAQAQASGGGGSGSSGGSGGNKCVGRMSNPITDICWSCVLPITMGSANITPGSKQDDRSNPGSPICICPTAMIPFVKIGLEIGFWEPTHIVETVRTPYCFPSLQGTTIDMGFLAPEGGQDSRTIHGGGLNASFYQAHMYANPVIFLLKILSGTDCLDNGSFDVMYITEMDPTWNSDELSLLLNPEVVLFASLPAAMVCIADCIAATAGMPLDPLIWCAGCNGVMFPVNGHVQEHIGGVEASALLVTRMLFKMHRSFLAKQYWGDAAVCGPVIAPMLAKTGYKKSLMYPLRQHTLMGQCCSPMGRTSVLWGAGMEFPVRGEDFVYQIYRKRNCCASYQQK